MRWPTDPPPASDSPWLSEQEIEADDPWWDVQGAADAANTLLDSVQAMLWHWNQLRRWPETRDGYEAVKALGDALSLALPYIKFPFGEYKPTHHKQPKQWHLPAFLIATVIGEAIIQSGRRPRLSRNSIVVRIVRRVLVRMEYRHMPSATAISAHLTRRAALFGNLPGWE
jgi:hypothetical protein